jgi:hypothetical protein
MRSLDVPLECKKGIEINMTTSNDSHQKSQTKPSNQNPLADIAGKFGGQFWLSTQSEIERSRKIDKEEINRGLNISSDQEN